MSAAAPAHTGEAIGIVGLGRIGGAVSSCLAQAGWPLCAFDVRPDANAGHPELPALAESPANVARASSIVFVAVVDENQLQAVLSGPDGLLTGAHAGLVIIVLSTVSLASVESAARLAAQAGVELVDCGVTGGGGGPGELVALIGGERATVARVTPVLEAFSKRVLHMGPLGAGMKAKLARNVVTYGSWLVADESARLADRAGIDRALLLEAIRESAPNVGPSWTWLAEQTPVDAEPNSDLQARREVVAGLMRKDLAAAEQLGAASGLDMPIARLARINAERVVGLVGGDDPAAPAPANAPGPTEAQERERGAATMEEVYGFSVDEERYQSSLLARYTLRHLFADVWSRPQLSIRDRRLMTMGAVAALGRGELWELQLRPALRNGEVTLAQMQEMVLHMAHYIGWPRTIAIERAVQAIIAEANAPADGRDDPRSA